MAAPNYRVALGHHPQHMGLEGYHAAPPMEGPPYPQQQQQHSTGGQFGILAPTTIPHDAATFSATAPTATLDPGGAPGAGGGGGGGGSSSHHHHVVVEKPSNSQLSTRMVVDPPDLAAWRDRLFHVDEMMVLTNEQFETYFPHIDNVYSHRSTQRYKRKPFVSHYWDCRMKGRPPGTPKSDDPNKKKRKRNARERDLCDVKIKITEYSPGAHIPLDDPAARRHPPPLEVGPGQKFWTIQRVNGNGGNGKGDGIAGPHRHTLAKSDDIKKNSVQRLLSKQEKETRKTQRPLVRKATGAALATVKKHARDSDLKLYAACFDPFSQRVWIALEAKGMAYQYCEVDPLRRPAPTQLLEANPRGLTPAIRHGDWSCAESGVILEYLDDLDSNVSLFPSDARLRASCRLWVDHINTRIVPAFFDAIQLRDMGLHTDRLQTAITSLVMAADEEGPYFLGSTLSIVDVHFAPFAVRLSRVLEPLRAWAQPVSGTRWHRWLEALENNAHVRATTSAGELYADTAELLVHHQAGVGVL